MSPEIVDLILKYTNAEASARNIEARNKNDIYEFLGILILMGANYDTKLRVSDLWSGRNVYIATMSRNRFRELIDTIR